MFMIMSSLNSGNDIKTAMESCLPKRKIMSVFNTEEESERSSTPIQRFYKNVARTNFENSTQHYSLDDREKKHLQKFDIYTKKFQDISNKNDFNF
jgi:hypothetical protein